MKAEKTTMEKTSKTHSRNTYIQNEERRKQHFKGSCVQPFIIGHQINLTLRQKNVKEKNFQNPLKPGKYLGIKKKKSKENGLQSLKTSAKCHKNHFK